MDTMSRRCGGPRRWPCGCASSAAWRPRCRRRLARGERDG
jgi:hypothetical protein